MEKKKFEFYQDVKIVTWKRQRFTIEAETEEEAEQIASGCADMDISYVSDIEVDDIEYMSAYEEQVLVSENNGSATIEVVRKRGFSETKISDNGYNPLMESDECLFEEEVVLRRP